MAWDYDYTDGADIIDARADELEFHYTSNDHIAYYNECVIRDEDIPF